MDTLPIKILLVEDHAPDVRLLQILLQESASIRFELSNVPRLSQALELLDTSPADVVLLDLSLPDSHGFETFRQMHDRAPTTPIIVLSGTDDQQLAIQAVREGAQDYLVKGQVEGPILSRAIRHAIERHRAEQVLQEREKHFRFLLGSITDYHYSVQMENRRAVSSTHSPGCVTVTGYTSDEYSADPGLWDRLIHPEDRLAVQQQALRVQAGETPPPLEHRILHKNGQVRWVRNTVLPSRDARGRLTGYDGLIADITERKVAEEKLIASEAFYHSLVENLPQNILRKNLEERFTFANQRFCAMLGLPLEQIIGKTDFDFFPPELARKYQQDDQYVIRTGKTFETIEENVTPSGEKFYVNVIKTPIYDANGQIIGIQGIFWDITERKRYEERLQQANAELARSEAALRKSHEELKAAQLQLIQAEKMESIGTLAAGVAHEVKNPLAILMMGVNYLNKKLTAPDDNMAMVLREMRDAINRADTIMRGLLDFSASRQLQIDSEDLSRVVEDSLRLVRHELSVAQVELVKELGTNLPRVRIDKNKIQQVFLNVLINAIQAMPDGGKLTVRTFAKLLTETSHSEGSRQAAPFWVGDTAVVAQIEDTGGGIPDSLLVKIFDPFFTTKPTGVGTGLGLPVSRKIIELHGGTFDLRNRKEGGGVVVTVMFKASNVERHEETHSAGRR